MSSFTLRRAVVLASIAGALLMAMSASTQDAGGEPCSWVPPAHWRIEIGWAEGIEADAIGSALDDATRRLVDRICAPGLATEAECDGLRTLIRPWHYHYNPDTGTACHAVVIKGDALHTREQELEALDRALSRMAEDIATAAPELVVVSDPIWRETNCPAAQVGVYLQAVVEACLGHQAGVRIDRDVPPSPNSGVVKLELISTPGGIHVSAAVSRPDIAGWKTVPGPGFSHSLFGLGPDADRRCAADELLGLNGGRRQGTDGHTVSLKLLGRKARNCEGDAVEPMIRVDRPSKVQLFGVQRDGLAHLLWPDSADGGLVEDELSMGKLLLEPPVQSGDERLVVVAIPVGFDFNKTRGWSGYCLMADPFSGDVYPPGAAVDSVSLSVAPARTAGCPDPDDRPRSTTRTAASLCNEGN